MANKKKTVEELVSEQTETELVDFLIEGNIITDEEVQNGTFLETPSTHIASYGETWVSISELHRGKESNYSYAKKLKALNSNKHLTTGTVLILP